MYLRSFNYEKPRGTFWENVCGRKHTDHTVTTNVLKDVKKKKLALWYLSTFY